MVHGDPQPRASCLSELSGAVTGTGFIIIVCLHTFYTALGVDWKKRGKATRLVASGVSKLGKMGDNPFLKNPCFVENANFSFFFARATVADL